MTVADVFYMANELVLHDAIRRVSRPKCYQSRTECVVPKFCIQNMENFIEAVERKVPEILNCEIVRFCPQKATDSKCNSVICIISQ